MKKTMHFKCTGTILLLWFLVCNGCHAQQTPVSKKHHGTDHYLASWIRHREMAGLSGESDQYMAAIRLKDITELEPWMLDPATWGNDSMSRMLRCWFSGHNTLTHLEKWMLEPPEPGEKPE
ncbi:MAG TPA: hypothetical protein ENN63_03490 [Bacteroidetes bacterium]|nr:hypothetical protein [Bacteroidota bacterium]